MLKIQTFDYTLCYLSLCKVKSILPLKFVFFEPLFKMKIAFCRIYHRLWR